MARPTNTEGELAASIQDAQRQFAAWRKHKTGRGNISDELWDVAANLVPPFSVTRVSKALGLNHTQLRDRVALRSRLAGANPPAELARFDFVQVQIAKPEPEPDPRPNMEDEGLIVEVSRVDGTTMMIRASIDSVDVNGLVAAFVGAPCCR